MSNFPDAPELKQWQRGEPLTADALNANFMLLLGLIETCMGKLSQPIEEARAAERTVETFRSELAAMRAHLMQRQRLRNEQQYAPLAMVGELQKSQSQLVRSFQRQLDDLQAALSDARRQARKAQEEVLLLRLELGHGAREAA